MFKTFALITIITLISVSIGYEIISRILLDPCVVQDDFRQCFFWGWSLFDKELFVNDFFTGMYQSLFVKTPLLYGIYKIAPWFTDDLILYGKIILIIISLLTGFAAFAFFSSLQKKYKLFEGSHYALIALGFTICIQVLSWSTDHLAAAHARSFIWFGLLLYMHFKLNNQNIQAACFTLLLLMISPISFLLCFAMEFFSLIINHKTKFLRSIEFAGLSLSGLTAAFMYLYLFKDIKTQGVGTPFSVAELKQLPEFNPGGRHPIFGSSIWDGTWWVNEHWGMGMKGLVIGYLIITSFTVIIIFLLSSCFSKKLRSKLSQILTAIPTKLFYASISLYFAAQLLFPTLYLPSRYLNTPSLLLSVIILYTCIVEIAYLLSKSKILKGRSAIFTSLIAISFSICFWVYFKKHYHPAFKRINPQVREALLQTPKNSLIAGHPIWPDLNTASITAKRKVFIDYERSMSYTKESLAEIRRRNVVALTMTYAKSKEEFVKLAKENGITHFLIHSQLFSNDYLSDPYYIEPYNKVLKTLTKRTNNEKFFLEEFLEDQHQSYLLIDLASL